MHFFSAAAFLLMLALGLPTNAGKCPRVCNCDGTKLTVACVGKNLTEVPPTIDEVRNSNVCSVSLLLHATVRGILNGSCKLFGAIQMFPKLEFSSIRKEMYTYFLKTSSMLFIMLYSYGSKLDKYLYFSYKGAMMCTPLSQR